MGKIADLMLMAAGGAGGGSFEPLTYRDSAVNTSDAPSYTFSNMSLGDPFADRHILVGIGYGGSEDQVTGVTVRGVTADFQAVSRSSATTDMFTYIFTAPIPTGTTGDVVVTVPRPFGVAIGVWSFGGTPTKSGSTVALDAASSYSNVSLTVPAGGFGVFMTSVQNGSDAVITGDATKRFGLDSNSNEWVSGSDITDAGTTTSSFTMGASNSALVGQAFSVS